MSDIPRQVDRRVRRAIAALTRPWTISKRRDHYFLFVENEEPICIAGNSSKANESLLRLTLERLRRLE